MTNASLTFLTLMNDPFKSLDDRCVVVYLNNTIVYSKTKQYHWNNLKSFMNILKRENSFPNLLNANSDKRVSILGHILFKDGIKSSPDKIKNLAEMPSSQDRGQLRTFIDMIAYLHRLIPNCG